MRRTVSLRDSVLFGRNKRSPSPRPSPLRCTSKSRIVISRVTHGSHMRKSGIWSITLSSHLILPSSTSVASAALVKALPVDPVKKIVSASTGWLVVMSRTPQPLARVTLPSSTMAMLTPGTPNCLRSCSTRCSKPAGGAASALAAIASAIAVNARIRVFSIKSLLNGKGLSFGCARHVPELPHAHRDERQDEGREQDVGERAVPGGDQRHEAETARKKHADDQDDEGNGESLPVRQLMAGAGLPRAIDAFVDRVDRAGAAFEQRGKDHGLEEDVERRDADALEQEVRRQRRALNLGIKGDHRDEEEKRRKHCQRARD